jgi:uncharacterized protein YbjT (DUF2867 family)
MMMRIAVAGGTGWLGRLVTEQLEAEGIDPVVLARSAGVDLTTGAGLDAALDGVEAVIDVSNITTTSRSRSVGFFEAATKHLLAAGERARVGHHVVLSIVGSDRVDLGYYIGKRRQEELALAGPVPASVLRATQFHEFAAQMLSRTAGPLVVAPKMLCEPVAGREVAAALVELSHRDPVGLAADLAGPRRESMPEMVRSLARVRGTRRPILALRLPGRAGGQMARGELLSTGEASRGTVSFADWLGTADARATTPMIGRRGAAR